MEFRSFLRRHLAGKPLVASPNVGCFLWLHLHISLNTPCFHPPPPPPSHQKKILHNLCLLFLMSISVVSGLIEDKAPPPPLKDFGRCCSTQSPSTQMRFRLKTHTFRCVYAFHPHLYVKIASIWKHFWEGIKTKHTYQISVNDRKRLKMKMMPENIAALCVCSMRIEFTSCQIYRFRTF